MTYLTTFIIYDWFCLLLSFGHYIFHNVLLLILSDVVEVQITPFVNLVMLEHFAVD